VRTFSIRFCLSLCLFDSFRQPSLPAILVIAEYVPTQANNTPTPVVKRQAAI